CGCHSEYAAVVVLTVWGIGTLAAMALRMTCTFQPTTAATRTTIKTSTMASRRLIALFTLTPDSPFLFVRYGSTRSWGSRARDGRTAPARGPTGKLPDGRYFNRMPGRFSSLLRDTVSCMNVRPPP